jgi:hypothetical protein
MYGRARAGRSRVGASGLDHGEQQTERIQFALRIIRTYHAPRESQLRERFIESDVDRGRAEVDAKDGQTPTAAHGEPSSAQ